MVLILRDYYLPRTVLADNRKVEYILINRMYEYDYRLFRPICYIDIDFE